MCARAYSSYAGHFADAHDEVTKNIMIDSAWGLLVNLGVDQEAWKHWKKWGGAKPARAQGQVNVGKGGKSGKGGKKHKGGKGGKGGKGKGKGKNPGEQPDMAPGGPKPSGGWKQALPIKRQKQADSRPAPEAPSGASASSHIS